MTTVAAIKKGNRISIASDSLALLGTRKELDGTHVYKEGKIIQAGPNYIGIAGHFSWNLVFFIIFLNKQ